jgi:Zn ribbon nucleic-acid-binding protein
LNTTDYSYKVDKEATCTAAGTGRYTWKTTTYGSFYFDVSIAAKGHSYTVSVTHPTCTEKGYTTYSCHCGDRYVSDYTDPLGHDMGKWTAINEATCTRNGLEIRECSRCDHSETRTIDALGHDWDDGVVTIEPTEKEEGEMTYTCERCGNTRTEPIPNLEHEHRYDGVVTAPTCTEQGFTTHTCRCGDSYIDSYTSRLGHSFTTYVSDNNATCTQDGTKTAICDRCDLTNTVTDEGSATDHHYGRVVIAPTCTEQGYITYTCECGESYTADYVDALGHDFTDWVVIQEPTDEEVGLEIRTCTRCGHEEQRGVTKPENPDLIVSGVCGIDLMWMLSSDGCLTISGTGEMFDFGSFGSPWFDYKEQILRVVIEDGTTSIGDYAFNYCANATSIQIPDSVTVIGQSAFDDCSSLPELNLRNNLVSIGSYAFYDCSSL